MIDRMESEGLTVLEERLRAALAGPLPGIAAQRTMIPAAHREREAPDAYRPSAVLVAIAVGREEPSLLLIERSSGGTHGGQIAFPGGRREPGDPDLVATALREAHEEIGLDPASVQALGLLSPLSIEASGYLVQPVLGLVAGRPALRPNPEEVAASRNRTERRLLVRGEGLLAPCYLFGETLVWGATAMILAELEAVLALAGI
jgi:8-oxo-dGTP pyrophosphatase MutT (NUDIX family)